jgi:hypothetical protein
LGFAILFLSKSELQELIGSKDVEQQAQWLKQHRIPFLIGLDNCPKVLIDTIFQMIGLANAQSTKAKKEPNWDRI